MSENLRACIEELKQIVNAKSPNERRNLLRKLSSKDCIYESLAEIAANLLSKNIPLSSDQKKNLRKHAPLIKKLTCRNISENKRKKMVIQSGGLLQFALPAVIAIIDVILNAQRH